MATGSTTLPDSEVRKSAVREDLQVEWYIVVGRFEGDSLAHHAIVKARDEEEAMIMFRTFLAEYRAWEALGWGGEKKAIDIDFVFSCGKEEPSCEYGL